MNERLSALIDDELELPDAEGCIARLETDLELRETWSLYHLIGDALRGHAGQGLPPSFADRLAAEPLRPAFPAAPRAHRPRAAGNPPPCAGGLDLPVRRGSARPARLVRRAPRLAASRTGRGGP